MKYNKHHIIYEEKKPDPKNPTAFYDWECLCCGHYLEDEWTVEIPAFLHRHLYIIQKWKATPERYAALTSFVHAITHEWNRMRRELDQEPE